MAARDAPQPGRNHECRPADGYAGSPANTKLRATSGSGPSISTSRPVTARPALSWLATPLQSTCPVTGTGIDKVLTDVDPALQRPHPQLARHRRHQRGKIASFYDDPVKLACDAWSLAQSFSFRKVTIDNGPYWQAQRWARFLIWFSQGTLRRARNRLSGVSKLRPRRAAASSISPSA